LPGNGNVGVTPRDNPVVVDADNLTTKDGDIEYAFKRKPQRQLVQLRTATCCSGTVQ
jgi:hypothetical protein